MEFTRQLCWHRSSLDGSSQPYLATVPHPWDAAKINQLPVVVLLHDALPQPTMDCFIEGAFVQAAAWLPIQKQGPAAILLQPFGFGNAGWVGWGAVQLADAFDDLSRMLNLRPLSVGIIGAGSGATGALQLAGMAPDCFSAVAAIDPWTTPESGEHEFGVDPTPAERAVRIALSPLELAGNLVGRAVYLESRWQATGLAGTADRMHAQTLAARLRQFKANLFFYDDSTPGFSKVTPLPRNPHDVWRLLLTCDAKSIVKKRSFQTALPRFRQGNGFRFDASDSLKPSRVSSVVDNEEATIRTTGLETFSVLRSNFPSGLQSLQIDRSKVKIPIGSSPWIRFDRIGKQWQAGRADEMQEAGEWAAFRSALPNVGTFLEIFFRRPTIVYGTIGDERQNLLHRQLAQTIKERIAAGVDSTNMHPCDHRTTFELPLANDVEIIEQPLGALDLILLGTPQTNLVVARLQGRLAIESSNSQPSRRTPIVRANPFGTDRIIVADVGESFLARILTGAALLMS